MKVKEITNPIIIDGMRKSIERYCNKIDYKKLYLNDYHHNESLLYHIYTKKTYQEPNGGLFLVFDNNQIISVSGTERCKFDDRVCYIAKRLSLLPKYRGKGIYSKYILPKQVEWARNRNYKMGLLTWNEDRETLYKTFIRISKGKSIMMYDFDRQKIYNNKLVIYDGLYNINHTPQFVIGYKIDDNFEWEPPQELKL